MQSCSALGLMVNQLRDLLTRYARMHVHLVACASPEGAVGLHAMIVRAAVGIKALRRCKCMPT